MIFGSNRTKDNVKFSSPFPFFSQVKAIVGYKSLENDKRRRFQSKTIQLYQEMGVELWRKRDQDNYGILC